MGEMKEVTEHVNDTYRGEGEVLETRYACELYYDIGRFQLC